MTALRFIHIVVAVIWIIGGIISSNTHTNYYYGWTDHKISHFLGTTIAKIVEGFCWWYLIGLVL